MKKKLKLSALILLSMLFSFTIMSVVYWLTYMDIQNNPTTLNPIIAP